MDKVKTDQEALAWAMIAAAIAHQSQTDYHSRSYLQHLIWVAGSMQSEKEMAVALLHDIIEDQPVTLAELKEAQLPAEIITAVEALTKRPDEDYFTSYLARVMAAGELAVRVKIADIKNNTQESRRHAKSESNRPRYQKALATLEGWLETNALNGKS